MKRNILLLLALYMTITVGAQQGSVFDRYFVSARQFAAAWPREKVYLHFDNTSYYQGDTIWFKAYVVDAATLQPSAISKPLYVELVDELGHVKERQIVKLDNGVGEGQLSLVNTFFTGFYEIRAYTKWMLAFSDDPQYFSRTFPIYRKQLSKDEPRSIAHFNMDASMKQRPVEKKKGLSVRFFPEGGHLVEGLPSVVGIEVVDHDAGWLNVSGSLVAADGTVLGPVAAIHDGMGSFVYTPSGKPAKVVFDINGKKQAFPLPAALSEGYVMQVSSHAESFDVLVSRSPSMADEELALFVFSQGIPQTFVPIDFGKADKKRVKVMTADLPAGMVRLSLVNAAGQPLMDRFCFVYPRTQLKLAGSVDGRVFQPFQPVATRLQLTNAGGQPLRDVTVSVSVRDGIESDYLDNQDNILTDLLLTSDLRGYVHKPGFYFASQSASRRKLLDNLLIIRGWRRYDLSEAFGTKTFAPKYLPEDKLMLYGQARSMIMNRPEPDLGVTILSQVDTIPYAGATMTDSLGFFSVPLDDFYGTLESLIQTKKEGKQYNRNTRVSLFRTFEPPLRPLDYNELNPQWDNLADTLTLASQLDSLAAVGSSDYGVQMLDEIVVKGKYKGKLLKDTEAFERDILAFYDISRILERMRDEGKFIPDDLSDFLYNLNPKKIDRDATTYGVSEIKYSVDGRLIGKDFINKGTLDMIESAMFYNDIMGRYSHKYGQNYRVVEGEAEDFFTHSNTYIDSIDYVMLDEKYVRCELTMKPRWRTEKSYKPTHGIRHTSIQGYNAPAAFYSPVYPDGGNDVFDDRRRTLYWNPAMKTDENGVINVDCYNSNNPTFVVVSAETIVDGMPAALSISSFEQAVRRTK